MTCAIMCHHPGSIVEDRIITEDIMTRLSPEDRRLIEMIVVGGLSYSEAGTQLGVPEGTAKSRLHYALRRAREIGRDFQ